MKEQIKNLSYKNKYSDNKITDDRSNDILQIEKKV